MMRRMEARPRGPRASILRRTVGLFRPYARLVAVLVVLIVVTSTLGLIPALIIREIVDGAIPQRDFGQLNVLFVLLAAAVLLAGLLGVALGYVNQLIGQGVMLRLREDLHEHLSRLSMRFFTQTRTGEILSRVSSDVNGVQQAVSETFTDFLTNLITLLVALALMFALEWRLALAAMLLVPLFVYPTMRVGMIQRRLLRQWHEELATMSAHLEETLSISGSMLVKSFGRRDHEAQRFRRSNRSLRSLAMRRMMAGRWFNMGTGLFGALAPGAVYWFGGRAVIGDDLTLGSVVALAVLTQRVFGPFAGIARINVTMLSALALFERIFEYLDLPVEVAERPHAVTLEAPRGRLTFERVTFAYAPSAAAALSEVTLEVEPGQMAALVGPSGAGKTTATYLTQRFYDPQSGRVLLDGHDLRDLRLDSIANAVGAVMQETYLFHTTLAENIRYGRLAAPERDLRVAASAAGLDELTARLPDGFETVVGERGYRLSGGEKQRVAIARAILKDPPVLILDEATASLDSRLERQIREATAQLVRGRTVVVIAPGSPPSSPRT